MLVWRCFDLFVEVLRQKQYRLNQRWAWGNPLSRFEVFGRNFGNLALL
jgi:hypothetical protein